MTVADGATIIFQSSVDGPEESHFSKPRGDRGRNEVVADVDVVHAGVGCTGFGPAGSKVRVGAYRG